MRAGDGGAALVRFSDVTMSVAAGDALPLPDDVRARFARTDILFFGIYRFRYPSRHFHPSMLIPAVSKCCGGGCRNT
mgnify:FL=1